MSKGGMELDQVIEGCGPFAHWSVGARYRERLLSKPMRLRLITEYCKASRFTFQRHRGW